MKVHVNNAEITFKGDIHIEHEDNLLNANKHQFDTAVDLLQPLLHLFGKQLRQEPTPTQEAQPVRRATSPRRK